MNKFELKMRSANLALEPLQTVYQQGIKAGRSMAYKRAAWVFVIAILFMELVR